MNSFSEALQISGGPIPHRPEEPVLGEQDTQHRLFTAVREGKEQRPVSAAIALSQK